MRYVVLSTDAAGQAKVEDVDALDDALQLVERLRNDEDVDDVRVLREVPIEVKTYYKVVALEDEASGGTGEAASDAAPPVGPSSGDGGQPLTPPPAPPAEVTHGATVDAPTAEAPGSTDGPAVPGPGDDGFFTPPPVRSHPIDEDAPAAEESSPSERRSSLFGRS